MPSKQEPPYYEAKAWCTTEEEIQRMKNLFPYFRAENYRLMSASTGPIGTKSHVQGVLPTGASLEEALMAKPGVCPITSTYNLTFEGEEVVIDAQSGMTGRIACPAGGGIFHFFPEIRDVSAFVGRSSRESRMLLEILSGETDTTQLSGKPGEQATFLCGTIPDILGGWMSMTLISTLFEALYGINKCTSVEVATWAGALAKENPSYPPVELLIRTVRRADGTNVRPNEVLFARSTLIGRDVPFKVFKRWALRDRTPIGPLLRPMGAAEVPYTGYVLLTMAEYRSALKTRWIRRPGKFAITVFPMRPEQVCRGEIMIGMEGAKVPFLKLPSPNNEGEFYVDDRVKYMDKRHVVVAVDLKWMAIEEAAGIYKTRRGLIAVREEIHAPFWRACYLHQEGDVIYIRPWAVRELNVQGPRRGVSFSWDNAPMHDYWCPRCAHLNMYGTILCNGCHLPIFYREWVPGSVRALVKHGQPIWLSELKAVRPSSWHEGETDAWAPLMASVNPIREVISCMITGLRCAPHLVRNPNADVVQVAFQEVAKVTSKDTRACVRASDEALERWVAKQLLIEESNTNTSVFAYLIEHPQQAAQWGRHMTRKGSLNSAFALYLSVHIFDAYRIGIEDGYLVPLYGLGASRADIIMSLVQAERRLTDFSTEDPSFDPTTVLDWSIDSLRASGGSITAPIEYAEAYIYVKDNKVDMVPASRRDGQCAIVFADPPVGKHRRRAATPRGDQRSATPRPESRSKGDQQKGKAPAQSWPKGGGHKGDQFPGKGHKGDQYKGKGGQYGYQQGQFGRGGSARSRTPTGGYQSDARGSGYKGAQAAPYPFPSPMYPTFPMGGYMQQPMAGMMPQMWPGAMPQGWQPHMQGDPCEFENPNSPHTPTWGADDELAETVPPPPGDWNLNKADDIGDT